MLTKIKQLYLKDKFMFALVSVVFVLIFSFGIKYESQLWRMIPLMVSLVVMLLQSNANRFAYLLGACNCVLYTASNYVVGLYATAASSLFMSLPLQVLTFLRWQKNAYKNSAKFKCLSGKQRVLVFGGLPVAWGVVYLIFSLFDSPYFLLDSTTTLVGIFATVLCILLYIEHSYLTIFNLVLQFVLYLKVLSDHPGQITYLVYNVYAIICVIRGYFRMRELYKEQQKEMENEG